MDFFLSIQVSTHFLEGGGAREISRNEIHPSQMFITRLLHRFHYCSSTPGLTMGQTLVQSPPTMGQGRKQQPATPTSGHPHDKKPPQIPPVAFWEVMKGPPSGLPAFGGPRTQVGCRNTGPTACRGLRGGGRGESAFPMGKA